MRRGLIARSPVELPDAVLEARLARVRGAMRQGSFEALLLYTNNTRPAGVSWLTGFVPYWSEALLVLIADRPPALVAALTYRVKSWIERTSRLGEVSHTPRVGVEAARMIAASKNNGAVAVPDLASLPAGIAADLRAGGLKLTDASDMFAQLRAPADPAEIALAVKAASIAHRALSQASGNTIGELIASAEGTARRLGAEEIYIAAAPELARDCRLRRIEGEAVLGTSFALRATVAYRGTWTRLVRTFGAAAQMEEAISRLAAAVAQLPRDDGLRGFSSWLVEGCRIAQPLEPLMGSRLGEAVQVLPRSIVSVQGSLSVGGQAVLAGAPALIGEAGEAASLLINPAFAA
jgi:Xaa-Pro aminopeptidase